MLTGMTYHILGPFGLYPRKRIHQAGARLGTHTLQAVNDRRTIDGPALHLLIVIHQQRERLCLTVPRRQRRRRAQVRKPAQRPARPGPQTLRDLDRVTNRRPERDHRRGIAIQRVTQARGELPHVLVCQRQCQSKLASLRQHLTQQRLLEQVSLVNHDVERLIARATLRHSQRNFAQPHHSQHLRLISTNPRRR